MTRQVRVAITQPYIPDYRIKLFEKILAELADAGVEARVFYGCERLEVARARGEVVRPPWAEEVKSYKVTSKFGEGYFRLLPADWADSSVLLTELSAGNGNAWWSLAKRQPYVLVGHGRGYVSPESRLSVLIESYLSRRARHVLTYMESGREEVIRRTAMDPARVSTFYNSTDTSALERAVEAITPSDAEAFRVAHGIPSSARCAAYVGALERYKEIGFLADALRCALAVDPSLYLIVVGDGPEAATIRELAVETGRVAILGHVSGAGIAILSGVAEVLVNPGRVGLVAVDAIALGLPVLTTKGAGHAPEIEYLSEGVNLHTVEKDPRLYAEAWIAGLDRERHHRARPPTLERAAGIISSTVMKVLTRVPATSD